MEDIIAMRTMKNQKTRSHLLLIKYIFDNLEHLTFFQGVTVQEGENSLITRITSQRGKIEVRREFTKDGMTQVEMPATN